MIRWLSPLHNKLRLIGLAAGALVVSAVFFWGYTQGQGRGFNQAYDRFSQELTQIDRQWRQLVSDRDAEVLSRITNEFDILDIRIQDYIRNDERERELLRRLEVINSTLTEIRNDAQNSDLGTCAVTDEFDRLLDQARDALSQPRPD